MREKLDEFEKNLTQSLGEILKDDGKHFSYGRIREALQKLHGLTDILLWEKKADGSKVPRDQHGMIFQRKYIAYIQRSGVTHHYSDTTVSDERTSHG